MYLPKNVRMFYHDGKKNYEITFICSFCQNKINFVVTFKEFVRIRNYLNGKGYASDLDFLPPSLRELFISGTCDDCWKKLFGEEDYDE